MCRIFFTSFHRRPFWNPESKDSHARVRESDPVGIIQTTHDEKYRGIVRRNRRSDRAFRDRCAERTGCAFDAGESFGARELDPRAARPGATHSLVHAGSLRGFEGGRYPPVRELLSHAVWDVVHTDVPAGRIPARP